ncbi:hypothetical protein COCVIDRAFT_25066 [Bipolaris victoriae FI3]|uniref:Uncharacterized protein n=2 Tax=Bipolaris TaxID=33194 RepID=W6YD48_COCC2|nr:uncharacterized protein COCCADRAFT_1707 [Bipolaris zeicola 26-R-13]XP_014558388.1 hypothetical protein COCVIDRAFT_25066 [Bipolaris victoriae FI3]EUC37472.1 hypothetical protein COCCADRAFT_1707 [Bipolaris zeicola 26-R-13]
MAVTTTLEETYVLLDKLDLLLQRLFPGRYSVKISGGYVEITAPRALYEDEKDSVQDRE